MEKWMGFFSGVLFAVGVWHLGRGEWLWAAAGFALSVIGMFNERGAAARRER